MKKKVIDWNKLGGIRILSTKIIVVKCYMKNDGFTLDMAIDAVEFPTCIPNTIDLDILIFSRQTIIKKL